MSCPKSLHTNQTTFIERKNHEGKIWEVKGVLFYFIAMLLVITNYSMEPLIFLGDHYTLIVLDRF